MAWELSCGLVILLLGHDERVNGRVMGMGVEQTLARQIVSLVLRPLDSGGNLPKQNNFINASTEALPASRQSAQWADGPNTELHSCEKSIFITDSDKKIHSKQAFE